jgi:putative phosphoribosyl transferase
VRFRDRAEAGRRLAERLGEVGAEQPVVVGLPRGGVPVAAEIARSLGSPLDVLVVRKLGHPQQPELGLGAIGEGGTRVLNERLIAHLRVSRDALQEIAAREDVELARRIALYRGDRPRAPVAGRTVVLVDDGLATGFTARAAVEVLRQAGARKVVLAIPVAPRDTVTELRRVADEVVCLEAPARFRSIGEWFDDFHQVRDTEVNNLITTAFKGAEAPTGAAPHPDRDPGGSTGPESAPESEPHEPEAQEVHEEEVEVVAGSRRLAGTLAVPPDPGWLVLFAHGSGSSRLSPRNRFVAGTLNQAGIATLLFDLLTDAEAADRRNVFDVGLLGSRLVEATAWSQEQRVAPRVGYFGASTGAAAALLAAAELGPAVGAVVSRGGRPDLAGDRLADVTAPTLLIVGERDPEVLELNRRAAAALVRCERELVVVPGATHLFEEPGTLEVVAHLAARWFVTHGQGTATPA